MVELTRGNLPPGVRESDIGGPSDKEVREMLLQEVDLELQYQGAPSDLTSEEVLDSLLDEGFSPWRDSLRYAVGVYLRELERSQPYANQG